MKTLLRRKSAAKTASTGESHLRVIFDNTNEHAICMLDHAGRIQSWNMSAERLMGYEAKEVMNKNYSVFFSKNEISRGIPMRALTRTIKKGRFTADGIRIRKDGSHFWARSFLTPVQLGKSEKMSFVLITQDITQARAFEQKKEEYIGIASHELRNPIQTLSVYSEILATRLKLDEDKENLGMLRDIQGQAARLVSLVDDLLLVSKAEGGSIEIHTEVFDPNVFFKKIVRDFQSTVSTHKIRISGKMVRNVRADRSRITQVVINLLSNAVKYSPTAKHVDIRMRCLSRKCVVSIQDYGSGMTKRDQREIFTRYFRTHDAMAGNIAGAGLGLYISKEILKRHRQRLWVKSSKNKGTTFFFTLPIAK